MDLIVRPWRHYADFRGRSRRTEFWLFFVFFYIAVFGWMFFAAAFSAITGAFGRGAVAPGFTVFFYGPVGILWLAGIVPGWAVGVRRLHDQNRSGWFILLTLVPLVGWICRLVIGFWPGTNGDNGHGADPRIDPEPTEAQLLSQVFS